MTLQAKQAMPNQPEKIGQVINNTTSAAKTVTSASRKSDLPTCMGGNRDDWRNHFLAAVRKTMNRRILDTRVQHRQRYSRFAGVLSTMVMLIGFSLLTATVVSAKTITVTGTGDTIAVDGVITLREAMTAANSNSASGDAPAGDPGLDTIKFNIPGAGVHTITLSSKLPSMSDVMVIDGTSQPGFAGIPLIEINGNNVLGNGFFLTAGSSSIKSLIINHFDGSGIILAGDGNTVVGNYIGTNAAGTAAVANTGDGILIGSSNNIIGGSGSNRNVISGNGSEGIGISGPAANGNSVRGNYIGTNAAGTAAIANGSFGIRVFTNNNEIGGAFSGNVISGNGRGVSLESSGTGNIVSGNFIGTNATGTGAIGNQEGISIGGANNTIGGLVAGTRNIISGNVGNGITLTGNQATGNFIQGNYIGTNPSGTAAVANGSYGIRIMTCTNNLIGGTTAAARNVISGNGRGVSLEFGASSN
ncbi:MAG TPA: hypothetical protein VFU37_07530, partial [Pyrinomonadaceae bacterium]|nr:hypothetical protein [Pyrinomonadaceae bacterium]